MMILTPYQERLIRLRLVGLKTTEIASRLKKNKKTMQAVLHQCYMKLGIQSSGKISIATLEQAFRIYEEKLSR